MAAEQQFNIKFVQEIEKYPTLYNYKLPEYMRKDTTEKIWGEIGSKFQITGPECKEKWKNLRSVFVRRLKTPKTGSGRAQKKPYYLAEYMQFAIPFIKVAGLFPGNSTETSDEHIALSSQPQTTLPPEIPHALPSQCSSSESEAEIPPSILQSQPSTSSVRSQSKSAFESQQRPPRPNKNYRKDNETTEKVIANYFKMKHAKITESYENAEQYSNKMFLLSILSDMNKMKDKQRRVFKRRVLELVDEIMLEDQDIVVNDPNTLLSTPSPINADIPVGTSNINDDSNSQFALYHQPLPLLLSNQDDQNVKIEDLEE